MILETFQDLTQLPYVDAIILFDNGGSVVEKWAAPNFNTKIVEALGLHFLQTFAILHLWDSSGSEILLKWERGEIYARTFGHFTLVVVGKTRMDFILLRILTNVALSELRAGPRYQKIVKKRSLNHKNVLNRKLLDQIETEYLQKLSKPGGVKKV